MNKLIVISPCKNKSEMLINMINEFTSNFEEVEFVNSIDDIKALRYAKLLFASELDITGVDIEMLMLIKHITFLKEEALYGSIGCILLHSSSELGTKRFAQDIIFAANSLGCAFIGHPLVEATVSLNNFHTWQKTLKMPLDKICIRLCSNLGKRLHDYCIHKFLNPNIVVLYSSPHKFSNTLDLWHMVSDKLKLEKIKEIQIENGKVLDCKGCSYKLCLHYGKQNSCFYGGFMVENVLPAIEEADIVVWLCPNYNDSISSNLTAVINRLTVLYYKMNFYNKLMYGIIVSGNSGSDSVAKQLIGSLNINKGFILPPYSILSSTANDPHAIINVPDIYSKAEQFKKHMLDFYKGDV